MDFLKSNLLVIHVVICLFPGPNVVAGLFRSRRRLWARVQGLLTPAARRTHTRCPGTCSSGDPRSGSGPRSRSGPGP